MSDYFLEEITQSLTHLENQQLLRSLRPLDHGNDPVIQKEENRLVIFSSNNYLGLANDPRLKQKAIKAMKEYGVGSGGARFTTGNFPLHEHLENEIALLKKKETAVLFSSGFLANMGVICGLMGKGDIIFSDEWNHASIIDGCRLSGAQIVIYQHNDMKDLEEKLVMTTSSSRKKLIITDGVFSMDGDLAPLPEITQLGKKYDAWVMVDDAHGTGVLGANGGGTAEYFGLEKDVQLSVGTLSKAVGAEGGFVACKKEVAHYLRNKARPFIFQTSLPPGIVAAAIEGLQIIQREPGRRQKLLDNGTYFRRELKNVGYHVPNGITPIIPVLIGKAEDALHLANHLEEQGIFAPAIRPPSVPEGSCRIRFTVMATHKKEDITQAIQAFRRWQKP